MQYKYDPDKFLPDFSGLLFHNRLFCLYIQTNNIAHFTKEFANVDIIVMVQNLTKHSTSYAIKRVLRPDQRFAISDSAGLQSIDRAIYRADNDLGARETQRNDIDYPIKR